jgi:hypothetical protein
MYTTTLTAEKIEDYTVMLCDALYMNFKDYQIAAHKRSIANEINMDYHQSKIDQIVQNGADIEFYIKRGRRYLKIMMRDSGGHGSVHAFVDRETGDVYKPANIKAPAKIARYSLLQDADLNWLLEHADWSGGYLYLK